LLQKKQGPASRSIIWALKLLAGLFNSSDADLLLHGQGYDFTRIKLTQSSSSGPRLWRSARCDNFQAQLQFFFVSNCPLLNRIYWGISSD